MKQALYTFYLSSNIKIYSPFVRSVFKWGQLLINYLVIINQLHILQSQIFFSSSFCPSEISCNYQIFSAQAVKSSFNAKETII